MSRADSADVSLTPVYPISNLEADSEQQPTTRDAQSVGQRHTNGVKHSVNSHVGKKQSGRVTFEDDDDDDDDDTVFKASSVGRITTKVRQTGIQFQRGFSEWRKTTHDMKKENPHNPVCRLTQARDFTFNPSLTQDPASSSEMGNLIAENVHRGTIAHIHVDVSDDEAEEDDDDEDVNQADSKDVSQGGGGTAHRATKVNGRRNCRRDDHAEAFLNIMNLRFKDPDFEEAYWHEWWQPASHWFKVIICVTSVGLVLLTALDIAKESKLVKTRALGRWSTVLVSLIALGWAHKIKSAHRRRLLLPGCAFYYFQVLLFTDNERLIKILKHFQEAGGFLRWIADDKYNIDEIASEHDFCRSMLPFVCAQLGFFCTFVRVSSGMATFILICTSINYVVTAFVLPIYMYTDPKNAFLETMSLIWVSISIFITTRRNENLARHHFLHLAFKRREVAQQTVDHVQTIAVNGCADPHIPSVASKSPFQKIQQAVAKIQEADAVGLTSAVMMRFERNVLDGKLNKYTMRFCDEDYERAFVWGGWRAIQTWIRGTGLAIILGVVCISAWDAKSLMQNNHDDNYEQLALFFWTRTSIRLVIILSLCLYFLAEKKIKAIDNKRRVLTATILCYFICITFHNTEVIWELHTGEKDLVCFCYLAFLVAQMVWCLVALRPHFKQMLCILLSTGGLYFCLGIGLSLSTFRSPTATAWESWNIVLATFTFAASSTRGEMMARTRFVLEYEKLMKERRVVVQCLNEFTHADCDAIIPMTILPGTVSDPTTPTGPKGKAARLV